MGSRDKDHTTPHQPLLSSLVVRATDSGGGGAAGGSDYEPGEVRRSDRFSDNPGLFCFTSCYFFSFFKFPSVCI